VSTVTGKLSAMKSDMGVSYWQLSAVINDGSAGMKVDFSPEVKNFVPIFFFFFCAEIKLNFSSGPRETDWTFPCSAEINDGRRR
jgi:hypothetical protein